MQMEVERKVLAFWSITVLGLTRKQRERKMIDRGWLARYIVQLAGVTVLVLREIK
jgi:phosphoribosyl-dephospho-CoA transferase